jgi:aspartyl-tRNA(Asn)/glutamyl-tRNA(Gln) amidotransferase subunit A
MLFSQRHIRREALESALSRLDALGDSRIFTRLYREQARLAATAADERQTRGERLGPVDGMLVAIKDNFDVAGEPTTAGSAIRRSAAPATKDAIAIARLSAAGAIIVGKTNMTEFAYSGLGINPHWGTPANAVAADRIPGGSSSGAGVAVGLGLVDVAIGTDTGGSVRIPAALNGVCGFKPTAERIPRDGVFPLSTSLDSVGAIAPSIAVCALAYGVMAGTPSRSLSPMPLAGVRFAVVEEHLDGCDAAVGKAFELAIHALQRCGASIVKAPISAEIAAMQTMLATAPIVPAEAARIHADDLVARGEEYDPRVLSRIRRGLVITPSQYAQSIDSRSGLITAMDRALGAFHGLLSPTTAIVAPRFVDVEDDVQHERLNALLLRNTGFANFFDLCSATIPLRTGGLPAGLMITCRHGHDDALLSIALGVERSKLED